MIKKLYADNYKSFGSLDIDVSNINVLLGPNSCGKSSITNLLLMLSQTADMDEAYENILRLNGTKSSLGEAINIFPEKNPNETIVIGWEKDIDEKESRDLRLTMYDFIDSLCDYFRSNLSRLRRTSSADEKDIQLVSEIEDKYSSFFFSSYVIENEDKLSLEGSEQFRSNMIKDVNKVGRILKKYTSENSHGLHRISAPRLGELFDFVLYRDENIVNNENPLEQKRIEFKVGYNKAREECELKEVTFYNRDSEIAIRLMVSGSKKVELISDIIDNSLLKTSRLDIVKEINLNSLSLLKPENFTLNCDNPFSRFIRQYIAYGTRQFIQLLSGLKINHVSPLRAFPQRYYLLEKSAQHNVLNSNDGSQLAEVLKNNPEVIDTINDLFKEFGIEISTAKTNDIIHRITVKQDNVTVELTDVGFGISQVLPIIVQAILSPPDSVTIIEQPEIHLHPKMQAWLTTALVDISVSNNKKFLIETHSETIIRRLQILMLDRNVDFECENMNLYHLERNGSGETKVTNVPFNDLGEVSWPDGFMDLEIDDSIKLQKLKVERLREKKVNSDV